MKAIHTLSTSALLLCCALVAQAQGVQRIVGPDGKVTYTDRAAPASAGSPAAPANNTPPLSYALRQAVQRYPVTLYTGDKCNPCGSARDLLQKRGVPFTEKTVTTPDDAQAFAKLGVDNVLPLITVGAQRVTGFQATELNRYLDAAGYPAESQLPRTHRNPAPQALAPVAAPAPTSPSATAPAAPSAAPAPVSAPPANPAGIRF
jgi:glutaredoxin